MCVDTKEPNKLNDKAHLEYLAFFVDQLYFFISVIRQFSDVKKEYGKKVEQLGQLDVE